MSSDLQATFVENVQIVMLRQNITQNDLASRLNVTQGYVSQVLTARHVPSLRVVERFAEALDVDASWLLISQKTNAMKKP